MVMSSKILGIRDRTKNFDPSDLEIGHIFPIVLSLSLTPPPASPPQLHSISIAFTRRSRPSLSPVALACRSCPSLSPVSLICCSLPSLSPVTLARRSHTQRFVPVALARRFRLALSRPTLCARHSCPSLVPVAVAPVALCPSLVSVAGARCWCRRKGSRHHCRCCHRLPPPVAAAIANCYCCLCRLVCHLCHGCCCH